MHAQVTCNSGGGRTSAASAFEPQRAYLQEVSKHEMQFHRQPTSAVSLWSVRRSGHAAAIAAGLT